MLLFFGAVVPTTKFDLPQREQHVIQTYTAYEWWLLNWADNNLACKFSVDHSNLPSLKEVYSACLPEVYQHWLDFPVCDAATNGDDLTVCPGLYLHYIGSSLAEREVVVELPPASVAVSLSDCQTVGNETSCVQIPFLKIEGVEPLPDQRIIRMHIERSNRPIACENAFCTIRLRQTSLQGEHISFWADSSYGDSSPAFEALIRVRPAPEGGWQVDVLSSQWTGVALAALALEWEAFPAVGEAPQWLSHPQDASVLASQEPYLYLAGQLIRAGIANADCVGGSLLSNGYASQCGLEQSSEAVISWQNRFDQQIFAAAGRSRLSPQLLKNLIAQESQFWPGEYSPSPHEFGLARLTETGAETTLMWNYSFYAEFCTQVLSEQACPDGYHHLAAPEQAMLRGALAVRMNGNCLTCQYGIDLAGVDFNIEVVAQSLLANAAQVGQIITNLTGERPGAVSSYEDLWRFTLVNYNAGAGCLSEAIKATLAAGLALDWQNVSSNLIGGCKAAISYVENITRDVQR